MTRLLSGLPTAAFLASYLYLAWFHGRADLLGTVVHEDGRHTFLETAFFFPHFLGHVPVLLVQALLLAGWWRCLAPGGGRPARPGLPAALLAFLFVGAVAGVSGFGARETLEHVLQVRQSAARAGEGGSWALHVPSTTLLFLGVPLVVLVLRLAFGRPVRLSAAGRPLLAAAALVTLAMTWAVEGSPWSTLARGWTDPRYLAHSVRELATFPVTIFPPALWLLFRAEGPDSPGQERRQALRWLAAGSAVFGALLAYQVLVPLSAGLGDLSQRPAFAGDGPLPVPYLLAFHYFEHFLDLLWFAPLCFWLAGTPSAAALLPRRGIGRIPTWDSSGSSRSRSSSSPSSSTR